MGKRYFCDYCNRSFADDLDARKKHLNGTLHIRTKKLHYKQYRDLKTVLAEEYKKEECRRFRTIGECQFGDLCNYTHYSKNELQQMKQAVIEEENLKESHPEISQATVEQWLESRLKEGIPKPVPQLPHYLYLLPDLPPSLQLPTEQDLNEIQVNEWG